MIVPGGPGGWKQIFDYVEEAEADAWSSKIIWGLKDFSDLPLIDGKHVLCISSWAVFPASPFNQLRLSNVSGAPLVIKGLHIKMASGDTPSIKLSGSKITLVDFNLSMVFTPNATKQYVGPLLQISGKNITIENGKIKVVQSPKYGFSEPAASALVETLATVTGTQHQLLDTEFIGGNTSLVLTGKKHTLNNVTVDGGDIGIHMNGKDHTITDSTIYANNQYGIIGDGSHLTIENSVIHRLDHFETNALGPYAISDPETFIGSVGVMLIGQHHLINNNTVSNFEENIHIEGYGHTVSNNDFSEGDNGIGVYADCAWTSERPDPSCVIGPGNVCLKWVGSYSAKLLPEQHCIFIPSTSSQVMVTHNVPPRASIDGHYISLEGAGNNTMPPIAIETIGWQDSGEVALAGSKVIGQLPEQYCTSPVVIELAERYWKYWNTYMCETKYAETTLELLDNKWFWQPSIPFTLPVGTCIFECILGPVSIETDGFHVFATDQHGNSGPSTGFRLFVLLSEGMSSPNVTINPMIFAETDEPLTEPSEEATTAAVTFSTNEPAVDEREPEPEDSDASSQIASPEQTDSPAPAPPFMAAPFTGGCSLLGW